MCQVSVASEKLMRKRAGEVIGDGVVVEKVALTFPLKDGKGGEEVKLTPFQTCGRKWSSCWNRTRGTMAISNSYSLTSAITGMDA